MSFSRGNEIRVLHLASWYPSKDEPFAVPFIKSHFEALRSFGSHRLVHIEVSEGVAKGFEARLGPADTSRMVLKGYRGPTRIREFLTLLLLAILRLRLGRRNWDVVLVHITWPTLRFPRAFRMLFGRKVVIVEHWSAYSQDFFLDPRSRAHRRMRKMFLSDTPIIAVSESLKNDISRFAQRDDLDIRVVPNVVDGNFKLSAPEPPPIVFMAANWNSFRKPFYVLRAMSDVFSKYPSARLIIGGGGPGLEDMKRFVSDQTWKGCVEFLGAIERRCIAHYMRCATIFVHPSAHETFSVVTAEALSCGVPAIVSKVGALPELIVDGENGFLVENNETSWKEALLQALDPNRTWDRKEISRQSSAKFSPEVVGRQLADILVEVAER